MTKTRCKFMVAEVTECQPIQRHEPEYDDGGKIVGYKVVGASRRQRVKLSAEYDQSNPEDQRFQTATPTGRLEMEIDNPARIDFFKPGESYYIDLVRCDDDAAAA